MSNDDKLKITLADVNRRLEDNKKLSARRLRDLRSAICRVAGLLGVPAERLMLDLPAITKTLANLVPAEQGLTRKSLSNIRSDFIAAVRTVVSSPPSKAALSVAWRELFKKAKSKRVTIGLSRFANYADYTNIDPTSVDDGVIEGFIAAVRERSLHPDPANLHRKTAEIWNGLAQRDTTLRPVTNPHRAREPQRIDWALLSKPFVADVEKHLEWCADKNAFVKNARPRPLAPRTIKLRRNQIHAAVTALVESGAKPASIRSIRDLVEPKHVLRILQRRIEVAGEKENTFNHDLGEALVQIAREWTKIAPEALTELRRLVSHLKAPLAGLTAKNKRCLRQFDDERALHRLLALPQALWNEAKRDPNPTFRTLAKAEAAMAIAILTYMPIRVQNLASLQFDVHVFLRNAVRGRSTLEVPAHEVKNRREIAFDIPPHVAKMLGEFRNSLGMKIIGRRPDHLFANVDGSPKCVEAVAWLVKSYLFRRLGLVFTPHQFRHLSAKILLDAEPGNFETVKQMLGHSNLRTTVDSYAGIDSRRAGLHQQKLIDKKRAGDSSRDGKKRRKEKRPRGKQRPNG